MRDDSGARVRPSRPAAGPVSLFEAEIASQLHLAAEELRQATLSGDAAAAESAADRLADLRDLHRHHYEPRRQMV